jgi:Spy/CpxP family protein refolding chaperone
MERMLRTKLVTGVVVAVVFGAGMLLGLALDRSLAATPTEEVAEANGARGAEDQGRRHPLYEQVGTTAEQKVRIDSIVGDYRSAMKALHAEFSAAYNPRYEALLADTRTAIKGVLTPEQAQKYDSVVVEYERRRAERSSRGNRE